MSFPAKAIVDTLREKFPRGSRVELTHMDDPFNTRLREGALGIPSFRSGRAGSCHAAPA